MVGPKGSLRGKRKVSEGRKILQDEQSGDKKQVKKFPTGGETTGKTRPERKRCRRALKKLNNSENTLQRKKSWGIKGHTGRGARGSNWLRGGGRYEYEI